MIISYSELPGIREAHADKRIVYTGGCFDLLHQGHVAGLEFSRSLGDLLVVGVCTDEHVRARKGPTRPIQQAAGRLTVVNALRCVDMAFLLPARIFGADSPTIEAITLLRPDVYVEEASQAERSQSHRHILEHMGTEVVYDEQPKLDSTTDIIHRVIAGTPALLAEYLYATE